MPRVLVSALSIYFLLLGAKAEVEDIFYKPNAEPVNPIELLTAIDDCQALEKLVNRVRDQLSENEFNWMSHSILGFCSTRAVHSLTTSPIVPQDSNSEVELLSKRGGYRGVDERCCGCLTKYRPRDLGRRYYPRFVPAAHCEYTSCHNRTHPCRPKDYLIKVLRRRSENMQEDAFLPEMLRFDWIFEDIPVPVACECAL